MRETPLIPPSGVKLTDVEERSLRCSHEIVIEGRSYAMVREHPCDARERPGYWVEHVVDAGDVAGDGRELDQEQTDLLIACELFDHCQPDEVEELTQLTCNPHVITIEAELGGVKLAGEKGRARWSNSAYDQVVFLATEQRGGIHSDPMVRVLALRAWGRRDLDFDIARWRTTGHAAGLEQRYFDFPLADAHHLSYDSLVELNDAGEAQLAAHQGRAIGVVHRIVGTEDSVTVRLHSPLVPTNVRLVRP